jgi:hypothetical protein
MADYVLPSVVEKRVRFFDGQFLQDQDFVDEQDYQLDREHRHNRLLHGPGVADGLTVTATAANQVTVAPGTAIDSDGNQLVLARPTTLDLPAADFNDKQGVQIYISFLATATDQQTVGGSSDFTRWLERPQLTALAPGNAYSGTASPALLASVALDNAGRVTVDNTVRTYSGLRLPGPGADAATLRATSGGQLDLAGGLTVDGNLGVGTSSPGARLQVVGGGGGSVDLLVNGRLRSDNNDGGLWVTSDRFIGGFGTGQMGFWNNGDWRLTVLNNGNVGIGTHNPGARLEVVGGGGGSVDLVVNGRLRSDNNDGGLWVASDRFVGGFETDKIGFYTNGQWRFTVQSDGNVGVGTTQPGYPLHVGAGKTLRIEGGVNASDAAAYLSFGGNGAFSIDASGVPGGRFMVNNAGNVGIGTATPGARLQVVGGGGDSVDLLVNGRMRSDNNDGGLWVTSDRFVGGFGDNIGFWSNGQWRLWVMNNGQTVTQGDLFVSGRLVYADGGGQWWHIHPQQSISGWWAANDGAPGPSDVRLKTDVRPVTEALNLVSKLQAVRYRWGERGLSHFTADIDTSLSAGPDATDEQHQRARDEERGKALDALSGDRLGLVAQDVEAVLPELVHDDADGYKHVRYQHLTALLAEAIKEQDAVVRALSAEVAALRASGTEGACSLCGSRRNGASASSRPSCRRDSRCSPSSRPGKPSYGRPCCASAAPSRSWRNCSRAPSRSKGCRSARTAT